jgi:hypothetical protein
LTWLFSISLLAPARAIPCVVADRLNPDGVVIMAFSDREPAVNSPDRVAAELGHPVRTLYHACYGAANNCIFEIVPVQKAAQPVSRKVAASVFLLPVVFLDWLYDSLAYLTYLSM